MKRTNVSPSSTHRPAIARPRNLSLSANRRDHSCFASFTEKNDPSARDFRVLFTCCCYGVRPNKSVMKNSIFPLAFGDFDEGSETEGSQRDLLDQAQHVRELLQVHGWRAKLTPRLLTVAFQRSEGGDRDMLVENTRAFFRSRAVLIPSGLETLPSPWLKIIQRVLLGTLKPHWHHIPYMISSLRLCNHVLCVGFAQEIEQSDPRRTTRWDELRMTLNTSLLPNLWTPLSREDRTGIWFSHPELREDILGFVPHVEPKWN